MLATSKKLLIAMLLFCGCAQAAQRCGVAALHDRVIAAAEKFMQPFVLFRGELVTIHQEAPSETGCCVGAECISVQCSSPYLGKSVLTPNVYADYRVNETIWGTAGKTVIHEAVQLPSPCGAPRPIAHQKVIVFCSVLTGWPDDSPMYCDTPIADTEQNLRAIRAWIPLAIRRQQRQKIPAEEAQAHLIHKVKPVYPKLAGPPGKASPKGDVVVRLFISRSGDVESINAISGPQELRQSAINAVSLWRYKPFHAAGHLVIADTTVTVHF